MIERKILEVYETVAESRSHNANETISERRIRNAMIDAWRALKIRCHYCTERVYLSEGEGKKPTFRSSQIWHSSCYIREHSSEET